MYEIKLEKVGSDIIPGYMAHCDDGQGCGMVGVGRTPSEALEDLGKSLDALERG